MSFICSKDIDFSKWYNDIIIQAELAENSSVRGCMIIKPYGYAIWENIKKNLDDKLKNTGHLNAYFPLLIPKSMFELEEKNAEGFAKECAVVTHYRLKSENGNLIVDNDSKLQEELIIRPTSESIIWSTYKKWIKSYRDLPILLNQWGNVIRWEMRNRMFLRNTEFLWQEGHTAHSTYDEAIKEAKLIINLYYNFLKDYLAIPSIKGFKSDSEKFAGAIHTYTIEALMKDGKALQAGTSHFLGQNFSKAFNVKFINNKGQSEYVWATSWGVSTRLMGALIMSHSDDYGLVLPPKISPFKLVIIPIFKNSSELNEIKLYLEDFLYSLRIKGLEYYLDEDSTITPGKKFNIYEVKGVPLRITVGVKDLENNNLELFIRHNFSKKNVKKEYLINNIDKVLFEIQNDMYLKSKNFLIKNINVCNNIDNFKDLITNNKGFIFAPWDGEIQTENYIKKNYKASIRCIPFSNDFINNYKINNTDNLKDIYTGKKAKYMVLYAKAY